MSAAAVGAWMSSSTQDDTIDNAVLVAVASTVKNAIGLFVTVVLVITSALYLGRSESPETAGTALVCLALFGPLVLYSAVCAITKSTTTKFVVRVGIIGTLIGLYSWSLSQSDSSNIVFAAAAVLCSTIALGVE